MKNLLNVTLYGLDGLGNQTQENQNIIEWSRKNFNFGNVILVTANRDIVDVGETLHKNGITYIGISKLSKPEYDHFDCIGINSLIKTDYCLGFHTDGFIINPQLWDDNFLDCDYIGAPWPMSLQFMHDLARCSKSGVINTVGNGGFCLRSKKFLNFCESQGYDWKLHGNWDVYFTVIMSDVATNKYKIKYAPEDLAIKFSVESDFEGKYKIENSFGFHGKSHVSLAKKIMSSNALTLLTFSHSSL